MSEEVPIQEQQQPETAEDSFMVVEPSAQTENPDEEARIKARMDEMEQEAAKLRKLNSQLSTAETESEKEKKDIDSRSVYIGNVDYGATPLEVQQHFSSAGSVNRVTILVNKFTGQPKGFAYLEFADVDGVNKAVATLDGSIFRDRELKVSAKRTNIPGVGAGRGRGRGRGATRGFRGERGRGRAPRGGGRFNPY